MTAGVTLGFDPGGEESFGVAILSGPRATAATVSSVGEAIAWTKAQCCNTVPPAAGIDTLLHWSQAPGGWRPADKYLRATYPTAKSSIISPNGLFGSMAIGGMALALRLRECWPEIALNETHPKILFHALSGHRYQKDKLPIAIEWFFKHSGIFPIPLRNDHELDAVISAWATQVGLRESWSNLVHDDGSLLFPAGPAKYLWPSCERGAIREPIKSV